MRQPQTRARRSPGPHARRDSPRARLSWPPARCNCDIREGTMVDAATQRTEHGRKPGPDQRRDGPAHPARHARAAARAIRAGADGGARLHGRGGAADPARAPAAAGCWRRACWPSCCSSPRSAMGTACSTSAAPADIRRPCWRGMAKTVVALESDIKLAERRGRTLPRSRSTMSASSSAS